MSKKDRKMAGLRDQKKGEWFWVNNKIMRDTLNFACKLVYSVLALCAGNKGECNPGIRTLAKLSGLSKDTVPKALKTLESKGYIHIIRNGPRKNSKYQLLDIVKPSAGQNNTVAIQVKGNPVSPQPNAGAVQTPANNVTQQNCSFLNDFSKRVQLICEKFIWTLNSFSRFKHDWMDRKLLTYILNLLKAGYTNTDIYLFALWACSDNWEDYLKEPTKLLTYDFAKRNAGSLRNSRLIDFYLESHGLNENQIAKFLCDNNYKPNLEALMERENPKKIEHLSQLRVFKEFNGGFKAHCPVKIVPYAESYSYVEESEIASKPGYKRQVLEMTLKYIKLLTEYMPRLPELTKLIETLEETSKSIEKQFAEEDKEKVFQKT